jgi:hypothetical protein
LQDQITLEEDKLLTARQGLDRLLTRRASRGKEGKMIREKRSKLLLEIEEAESSQQEKLVALEEYRQQLSDIQVIGTVPLLLASSRCSLSPLPPPGVDRRRRERALRDGTTLPRDSTRIASETK